MQVARAALPFSHLCGYLDDLCAPADEKRNGIWLGRQVEPASSRSIMARLYMRMPDVGSVMVAPVVWWMIAVMSFAPAPRAPTAPPPARLREAITMSAPSSSRVFAMVGMYSGICWPSESICTAAS